MGDLICEIIKYSFNEIQCKLPAGDAGTKNDFYLSGSGM